MGRIILLVYLLLATATALHHVAGVVTSSDAAGRLGIFATLSPYDDTSWLSSLTDVANVTLSVTSGRSELQESVQFIVDNYEALPLVMVFLHGPPDDRQRLPGGSMGMWDPLLSVEGSGQSRRPLLTANALKQMLLTINPREITSLHLEGDESEQSCAGDAESLLQAKLFVRWRGEEWLQTLREQDGLTDLKLAGFPCRLSQRILVHRDVLRKRGKMFWESLLRTATSISEDDKTQSILHGSALWNLILPLPGRQDIVASSVIELPPSRPGKMIILPGSPAAYRAPIKASESPYRGIQLSHLLKAGGTAAFEIINQAARCGDLGEECLAQPKDFTMYGRQKFYYELRGAPANLPYFRIHVMREPCSYYVGMWRFQGKYLNSHHPHKIALSCLSGNTSEADYFPRSMRSEHSTLKTPEHTEAFSRWMQSVHAGATLGTLSHRLWCTGRKSYPSRLAAWSDGQLEECSRKLPPDSLKEAQEGLADPDELFSKVHCWVDMSNLNVDLASCLRQFEKAHPGSIDLEFISKLQSKPSHNATWPCKAMFDSDLEKRVMEMDGPVFQRFGYRCCRSHGFHERHLEMAVRAVHLAP